MLEATFAAILARRSAVDPAAWVAVARDTPSREDLLASFAGASRTFGAAPLALTADEGTALAAAGLAWSLAPWAADDLARVLLLLVAMGTRSADAQADLVHECYHGGDARERQAVLRALALLPEPGRFTALARDACRSNIQPIFEALACENPFPAAHLADGAFNQLVMKAIFTGVPLMRILHLDRRRTPELARMVDDYAAERRAAGRSIPADIDMARGVP